MKKTLHFIFDFYNEDPRREKWKFLDFLHWNDVMVFYEWNRIWNYIGEYKWLFIKRIWFVKRPCSFLWERTLDNLFDICSIQAPNKWFKVSLSTKLVQIGLESIYHQNRSFVVEFQFQKFRARNSLFLHEFEPKESRRATKVNWICIYIFRFFWAYIITNLRVNKSSTGKITFRRFYKLFEI